MPTKFPDRFWSENSEQNIQEFIWKTSRTDVISHFCFIDLHYACEGDEPCRCPCHNKKSDA